MHSFSVNTSSLALALVLSFATLPVGQPPSASEIKMLAVFPVGAAVRDLAAAFSKETGHIIKAEYIPTGVIRKRLASGEATDVIILSNGDINRLVGQKVVVPGTHIEIARIGLGLGVRKGAAVPDVSTPEALKQVLLSANSIIYANPSLGALGPLHFHRVVLSRLGIAEAMKPKTVFSKGGLSAPRAVASGKVELVVQSISELIAVKEISLAGPLPKALQWVGRFSAGLATKSTQTKLARAFIGYLARPEFRSRFAEAGLDYRD